MLPRISARYDSVALLPPLLNVTIHIDLNLDDLFEFPHLVLRSSEVVWLFEIAIKSETMKFVAIACKQVDENEMTSLGTKSIEGFCACMGTKRV